jgi:zinc transporter ZupT
VSIEWRSNKRLLWLTGLLSFSVPIMVLSWFVVKFDLPLIHGGDVALFRTLAFIYWVAAGIFIFGFRLRQE